MFRKRNIFILIIILLIIGTVWWLRGKEQEEEIRTDTVRRGTVVETVSVTGKLVPVDYADLSFLTSGKVKKIFVEEGEKIERGDVLAALETDVLEAQLKEANTALAIAIENEKLARRRWDDLKPEERTAQKLKTEQARDEVRIVLTQLANARILSPLSGTISHLDVRPGESVAAAQVVLRVIGDETLVLESRIPESDIAKIKFGQKARLDFDALPSADWLEGEVIEIETAPTVIQDVVSYKVTFRLSQLDDRLREGMTADIDVETTRKDDVLLVPFRALTREGSLIYAEVLDTNGEQRRVLVVTGIEGDDGTTEILSGLNEGDQVTIGTPQTN